MTGFVFFILSAVTLGAGAMLAPIWETRVPRVAWGSAFSLAFVLVFALIGIALWGWQTLTIDYVIFGGVSFVILGGTLAQAQTRAEAQGVELAEEETPWLTRGDWLFLAGLALISALLPSAPLQVAGIGVQTLSAYLSTQLRQAPAVIDSALASFSSVLVLWVLLDALHEWHGSHGTRRIVALVALGVWGLQVLGYAPLVLSLGFVLAGACFAQRAYRHGLLLDRLGAVMLWGVLSVLISRG